MKKHINIPVFIPHLGCPNDCVFCNQRSISGKREFDEGSVRPEIENALATIPDGCTAELAFFGGSFTGIDRGLMLRLLSLAKEYFDAGRIDSVRVSTRPDYISDEILEILSSHGVKTVELGIQSMDERVLAASKRGHTPFDSENACRLVKQHGLSLIGQMMTGLPEATPESEIYTAKRICELGADGARIYPTMVFHGTELEAMAERGIYIPPELDDAVKRTAAVLRVFTDNKIPVIRIGLHSGESLYEEDGISRGAYHPAMGELVEGELYFSKLFEAFSELEGVITDREITVTVKSGELSKAVGHKKRNKERLLEAFKPKRLLFSEDPDIERLSFEIKL